MDDETMLAPALLVVGAGRDGVTEAAVAARAGVPTVLLAEEGDAAEATGVAVLRGAAWGAFRDEVGRAEIAVLVGERRVVIRPRAIVLAERRFEAAVPIPGATLPGCSGIGAVLAGLARGELPAGPVALAGDGPALAVLAGRLRRRGVELAVAATASKWGARVRSGWWPEAVLGERRVDGLVLRGTGGVRTVAAATVVLHWGFQAETALARVLGVAHRVEAGRLEPVVDGAGRTDRADVFVSVGGGVAGAAAAASLGFAARAVGVARRRVALSEPGPVADAAVVCACEGVTAGEVRLAGGSLPSAKRATRAGMGACGGRLCAGTIARLFGVTGEAGFAQPRVPLRPVVAARIMAERPDPADAAHVMPVPTRWRTVPPGPVPEDAEIAVIGGGIVGLACAWTLARAGRDVLVLDRAEPGLGASTANAGSLHVQLVPYVYQEGSGGPMGAALPLGPESIALWREIAAAVNESLGLRQEGGLVLAETAAQLRLLESKAAFERGQGIPSEVIGAGELRALAPGLGDGFAGAVFCPLEGQGDPLRGTAALGMLARRAGVRIAAGVDVAGLEREGAGWRVTVPGGAFRAGQVVNAAGAQAGRVAALAGVDIPVQALVQQVVVTEARPTVLRQLVAWTGRHLSLKQGDGGHLLIGGGWPGRLTAAGSTEVLRGNLEGNVALAARALPAVGPARVVRAWTGLAPHLARGPVISGTPGHAGLWHAVSGNGYTLGPVMGRMVAEAVLGRRGLPAAFGL